MAKLSNLKPRLTGFRSRLDTVQPRDEQQRSVVRTRMDPAQRWYKLNKWVQLRAKIMLRDRYTCKDCGRLHTGKGTAVVDHVKPHRGSEALFWDETNLQVLCKSPCHDKHKQKREQQMPKGVWY